VKDFWVNKVMVFVVGLFIAVSIDAMELKIRERVLEISKEENKSFVGEISHTIEWMGQEKKIPAQNPILFMLNKMMKDIQSRDNNVLEMIVVQKLEERIHEYKNADNDDPIARFMLKEIQNKPNKPKEEKTKDFLITYRITRSSLALERLRPQYCPVSRWSDYDGIVGFCLKNTKYPLDEDAIKDFVSLLIYQAIFAQQIDSM
jgi:hypothetical protein